MIEFTDSREVSSRQRWAGLVSKARQVRKLALLGVTLLGASAADAKIIYVNAAKTGGNGTSWSRAFTYLQDALEVAVPGDNVYLAKGTYYPDDGVPNGFGDREISFEINRVNLYGGFAGNETSITQRNISANPTIVSGKIWAIDPSDPDTVGFDRYWSLHVFILSGSCRFDGLIVEGGRASGEAAPFNRGGGVLVAANQTLTLANCVMRENLAAQSGGAVYGKVVATNTRFIDNQVNNEYNFNSDPDPSKERRWLFSADCSGGAIEGETTATRCSFINNQVVVEDLGVGAGNFCSATGGAINGTRVTITDCNFDANGLSAISDWTTPSNTSRATSRGGAVSGPTTATRCTFTNNAAYSFANSRLTSPNPDNNGNHFSFPNSFGGAIAGRTVAVNCVFTDNNVTAESGSGDSTNSYCAGSAIYAEGASSMGNSVFVANTSLSPGTSRNLGNSWRYNRGAVLAASGSTVPISNCTFLDNASALFGDGAAVTAEGSVNIISNVFWYDAAPATGLQNGWMIWVGERPENAAGGRARISNRLYPTPSTETINIVRDGFAAVDGSASSNVDFGSPASRTLIDLDPAFADIASPIGADGIWRTSDDGLRITAPSSAIGRGLSLFLAKDTADLDGDGNTAEGVPNDIANYVRIQGGTLDLGAYEFGDRINAPDISIEQPAGVPLVDNLNTVDLSSTSAQPQIFVIRNTGLQVLNQLAVVATGVNSSDFVITQPKTNILSINATTTFTVSFRPSALGNRVAKISVISNDPDENPFDIALTGNAQLPDIAVEYPAGTGLTSGTSTIDFGAISSTASSTRTFTIRNTGLGNLALDSIRSSGGNASSFIPSGPVASFLAPGASTTFTVRFDPSLGGNLATTIVIGNSDPDAEAAFQVKVKGLGVKAPEIVVSQPFSAELKDGNSVGFGSVRIASNYTKTFVIKNTGTLQLSDIKVSVSGSKTFSRGEFKTKKLAVGASAEFTVTFNPTSTGSKSANLRIVSNDSDERQIDITLKGKGVTKGSNNAPKNGSNRLAAAFAATATSADPGVVTTVTGDDGLKYQTLTVEKVAGEATGTVQVSSDLLDWYSGSRHTTTLVDSASILKVRDNTPVRSGEKRYIRVK